VNLIKRLLTEFFPKPDDVDISENISTSGYVSLRRLRTVGTHRQGAVRYQPVSTESFNGCMSLLPPVALGFTFIDLGCGKGRALVLARKRGFCRVIGVEFAPALASVARRNVPEAEITIADAAAFNFPDCPLVVFLYNPFGSEVLEQVADHLSTRRGFVAYVNPVHDNVLASHSFTLIGRGERYSAWSIGRPIN
jgi:SAM-dependent methyltransferase